MESTDTLKKQKDDGKFWAVLRIGPQGIEIGTELWFYDRKPIPAYELSHGEGQILVFEMIDGDYSTTFAKAMKNGWFIRDYRYMKCTPRFSVEKCQEIDAEIRKNR